LHRAFGASPRAQASPRYPSGVAAEFPNFDLYAELEVSERASVETIQAAYRSLQLRHHPDRVGDAGGDRAVRLNIARDWLTDPDRRARYDRHVAELRAAALDEDGAEDEDEADDGETGAEAEGGAGAGAAEPEDDEEPDDADDDGADSSDRATILDLARRHLRLDVRRLFRIWLVALAALGVVALIPGFVDAVPPRLFIAVAVTVVLVGIALGWTRGRDDDGMASAFLRGAGMLVGWVLLGVLALEGAQALVQLARGEHPPLGIADVAVPALLVAAVISLFAIRRRHGPVDVTIDEFLAMTPREFEIAVGQILGQHGYRLTVTGGPGDLAADLIGTDGDGRSTVVQCKRYAPGHPVGSRDVQMLIAMGLRHHDAEHLILVTTSEFTDPARDLADEHDVELIDGEDLEDLTR
jgi:hypothetical protein